MVCVSTAFLPSHCISQAFFRVDEELVRQRAPRFILPKTAQWPYVEGPEV
jgi:hypothetical protein